jgi:putative transposase
MSIAPPQCASETFSAASSPTLRKSRGHQGHLPADTQRQQIEKIVFDLRLPGIGRSYINRCIKKPNTPAELQRRRCIRFMDRRLDVQFLIPHELAAFATILCADPRTIFIFSFPPPIQIDFVNANEKLQTSNLYAPDFLVIRADEIVVVCAQRKVRLLVASQKAPSRYSLEASGRFNFLPATEAFLSYGLRHELMTEDDAPRVLVENISFLEDYRSQLCPPLDLQVNLRFKSIFAERRVVSFEGLRLEGFTADEIFKAIAETLIYVDLSADLLDITSSLLLYSDRSTYRAYSAVAAKMLEPPLPIPGVIDMQPGSELEFGGKHYVVILGGERDVILRNDLGREVTFQLADLAALDKAKLLFKKPHGESKLATELQRSSNEEIFRAQVAFDEILKSEQGQATQRSSRTIREYRRKIKSAQNQCEAILLLKDNIRRRGNRNSRITAESQRVIKIALGRYFNRSHKPTCVGAYSRYCELCAEISEHGDAMRPVSIPTFWKWSKKPEYNTRRSGRSEKYQKRPIIPSVDSTTTYHGVRPHEVCYVDHTIVPIVLIDPSNRFKLPKPTLTLGHDAAVNLDRAMVLLWAAASIDTVLLLCRDYVRRWKTLPRVLSFDHGSELASDDVRAFAKLYGIEIRFRKLREPRNGASIESRFAAAMKEIISNTEGNTISFRKNAFLLDPATDPYQNNSAKWTLEALHGRLDWYFFEHCPKTIVDPRVGLVPASYEQLRYEATGHRQWSRVEFDQNLLLATCAHPRRSWTREIDKQRGVFVDGSWHWAAAFAAATAKTAEIRVEPWLSNVVYCGTGDGWVAAISKRFSRTRLETRYEVNGVERYTQAANRLIGAQSRKKTETLLRAAETYDPSKFDERLAVQANEQIRLYRKIGMTTLPMTLPISVSGAPELSVLPCLELDQGSSNCDQITSNAAPAIGKKVDVICTADSPTMRNEETPVEDSKTSKVADPPRIWEDVEEIFIPGFI